MKISMNQLRGLVRSELSHRFLSESELDGLTEEAIDEPVLSFSGNQTLDEHFETVDDQNLLREAEQKIEEIKSMSAEFKRMKQLVDFRRPLLGTEKP